MAVVYRYYADKYNIQMNTYLYIHLYIYIVTIETFATNWYKFVFQDSKLFLRYVVNTIKMLQSKTLKKRYCAWNTFWKLRKQMFLIVII